MTKKKIITIIILALGMALMLAGIVILCQAGTDHCGYGGGVSRASTSIKFGGDFYTTSAQYTGLAANAVTDLYELLSIVTGVFFIFVGGMDVCVTLLLTDIKSLFKDIKSLFKKEEVVVTSAEPIVTE